MKLRYLFLSILAGSALAAGCAQEQVISSLAEFKPEVSCIGLPYEGGISSTAFTATASWSVDGESVPEWLTVSPMSGGSGSDHLVFATDPNPGVASRSADILVNVAGRQQRLLVTQAGAGPIEAPISTVKQVEEGSDGEVFRVRGTVTSVASTYYGNMYVKDATGTIYLYGIQNEMGQDPRAAENGWESFGIEAGDVITVQGPRQLYNGTLELYYATLIEVEKAQILMDETEFKVESDAGSLEIYATVKANGVLVQPVDPWIRVTDIRAGNKDEVIYSVEYDANTTSKERKGVIEFKAPGYVMEVSIIQQGIPPTGQSVTDILSLDDGMLVETLPSVVVAKSAVGFMITDGTSTLYVYDKNKEFVNDVAIGDNVKVFATKKTYGGIPELDPVTGVEKDGTAPVNHPTVKDITAEALTYEAATSEYIQFTGTLKVSGTYYNVEIDGVDASVRQGSIASPLDELNAASYNGKVVTVTGYFSGLTSSGKYLNIVATKITEANAKGSRSNPYTPSEAAAAVKDFKWSSNTDYESTDDVYVAGKICRIASGGTFTEGGTYGNASFYLSADGTGEGNFYCFRVLYLGNKKFESGQTDIKVGDDVVIYGKLMNYQGNTPETVSGKAYLYSLNGKTE